MTRKTRHALASVLVAAVALGAVSIARSGPGGSDAIKARQEVMETIGEAINALAAIAKNEAPFDAGVVKDNAETIAEHLKMAATLFPEGSDKGDVETWAKPEIWADRAGFEKRLQAAQTSAVALQSVTEEAAFRPALGELGNNCKACHDKYRRPKD